MVLPPASATKAAVAPPEDDKGPVAGPVEPGMEDAAETGEGMVPGVPGALEDGVGVPAMAVLLRIMSKIRLQCLQVFQACVALPDQRNSSCTQDAIRPSA